MSHMFSSPSMPAPAPPPTPPPTPTDPAVQAAATALQREQAQAMGAQSTLLTSGQGATDPLTTAKKSLLGA